MKARSYRTEALIAAVTAGIVGLMFLLNDVNRQIRIKELRINLQRSGAENNGIDHIALVARYRLHKKLYENRITQDEADVAEMRVVSIVSGMNVARSVPMERYKYVSIPAIAAINSIRWIIGKGPIRDVQDDPANTSLAIAYYYERNSHYAKALEIYDRALDEEKHDRLRIAAILLHKGYCRAVLGDYGNAKRNLTRVIDDYGDTPVANTALILLRYIEGFRSETRRVLKIERDSADKSEKLYRLIDSQEALNVIGRIEKTASPAEKPRIRYIKGRCLEELAMKEKAIDTYQKIVSEYEDSKYAKFANRRIYISGALADNGKMVKKMALANNAFLKDGVLNAMLNEESKLRDTTEPLKNDKLDAELKKFERRNPVLAVDKIESLKNMVKRAVKKLAVAIIPAQETVPGKTAGIKVTKVRIQTIEGNVFIGVIIKETKDSVIINSILGNVKISKSKIIKRSLLK